ncbi:hypothetical protein SAMN05720606_1111, partial [Paenibacillus polysaccharolyticus]
SSAGNVGDIGDPCGVRFGRLKLLVQRIWCNGMMMVRIRRLDTIPRTVHGTKIHLTHVYTDGTGRDFVSFQMERIRNFRTSTPLLVVVEMKPNTLHDFSSPALLLTG